MDRWARALAAAAARMENPALDLVLPDDCEAEMSEQLGRSVAVEELVERRPVVGRRLAAEALAADRRLAADGALVAAEALVADRTHVELVARLGLEAKTAPAESVAVASLLADPPAKGDKLLGEHANGWPLEARVRFLGYLGGNTCLGYRCPEAADRQSLSKLEPASFGWD